jgi:hypothetical protein
MREMRLDETNEWTERRTKERNMTFQLVLTYLKELSFGDVGVEIADIQRSGGEWLSLSSGGNGRSVGAISSSRSNSGGGSIRSGGSSSSDGGSGISSHVFFFV